MKLKLILAVGIIIILNACNGDKLSKNGLLEELPSIVMNHYKQESKLREEMAKSADSDEAAKILVNGIAQDKAFKEKIIQAGKKIITKEIPTETSKNIHINILQPMKIDEVDKNGTVRLVGEGELTSDGTYMPNIGVVHFPDLRIILSKKDDNAFYTANLNAVPDNATPHNDLYSKGTKLKLNAYIRLQPWNAQDMSVLKSITITTKDRDDFRNADKAMKEAKQSFEQR